MASSMGSRVVALLALPFFAVGLLYLITALAEDRMVLLLIAIGILAAGGAIWWWAFFRAGEP